MPYLCSKKFYFMIWFCSSSFLTTAYCVERERREGKLYSNILWIRCKKTWSERKKIFNITEICFEHNQLNINRWWTKSKMLQSRRNDFESYAVFERFSISNLNCTEWLCCPNRTKPTQIFCIKSGKKREKTKTTTATGKKSMSLLHRKQKSKKQSHNTIKWMVNSQKSKETNSLLMLQQLSVRNWCVHLKQSTVYEQNIGRTVKWKRQNDRRRE